MSDNVTTPLGPVKTTTLYAVVSSDGTLQRGVGAVCAVRKGCGLYTVTFNVDVSLGCANATIIRTEPKNAEQKGILTVTPGEDTVNVNIWDQTGKSGRDQTFCLTVTTAYGAEDMT